MNIFGSSKKEQINSLTHELNELKLKYDNLQNIIKAQNNEIALLKKYNNEITSSSNTRLSIISDNNLYNYVDEYLKNPSHNIGWIPDNIERVPYKEGAKLALLALATAFDNSSVGIFGHRVRIIIDPE